MPEVCYIKTGKLDANQAVFHGKYPFFTCGEKPLRIDRYAFDDDAIILAGNNAQGRFHIQRFTGKFNAYQRTYVITAKSGWNVDYIKYAIELALQHLQKIAQGSQTKFLTLSMLEDFQVRNIDYSQQISLFSSVRNLDRKIAANQQINENLEQMALTMYMQYFFERTPNGKLGSVLVEHKKSNIQVGEAQEASGNVPFFTSGDSILKWDNALVNDRCCYLNTGGNADVKFYVGKAAYSTDTWCVSGKDQLSDYIFLLLNAIKPELDKKFFQGTGLKHLQKPLLKDRPIYIPTTDELSVFNAQIMPMMTKISENTRENQQLIRLRDWLLPMLMNGQATVAD